MEPTEKIRLGSTNANHTPPSWAGAHSYISELSSHMPVSCLFPAPPWVVEVSGELLCLELCLGDFLLASRAFCLRLELLFLQWESSSTKHHVNCKPRSSTISKKTLTKMYMNMYMVLVHIFCYFDIIPVACFNPGRRVWELSKTNRCLRFWGWCPTFGLIFLRGCSICAVLAQTLVKFMWTNHRSSQWNTKEACKDTVSIWFAPISLVAWRRQAYNILGGLLVHPKQDRNCSSLKVFSLPWHLLPQYEGGQPFQLLHLFWFVPILLKQLHDALDSVPLTQGIS